MIHICADLCRNVSTSGLILVLSALSTSPKTTTANTPETPSRISPEVTFNKHFEMT